MEYNVYSSESDEERDIDVDTDATVSHIKEDGQFTKQDCRREEVNNVLKYSQKHTIAIEFSQYLYLGCFLILISLETGGPGFENYDIFQKSITISTSDREGVNNRGVGNKSILLLKDHPNYTVIKGDTRETPGGNKGVVFTNGEPTSPLPKRKKTISKRLWEYLCNTFPNTRFSIGIFGQDAKNKRCRNLKFVQEALEHRGSPQEYTDMKRDVRDLGLRYGNTNLVIKLNGVEVSSNFHPLCKDMCQVKEGDAKYSNKPHYDTTDLLVYNNGVVCLNILKTRETFHCDLNSKQKFLKSGEKKFQSTVHKKGDPICELSLTIFDLYPPYSKQFPEKMLVVVEKGPETYVLTTSTEPLRVGWPNIRIILTIKEPNLPQLMNLRSNKSNSEVKPDILRIILQYVNMYYLDGVKDQWSPAFNVIKNEGSLNNRENVSKKVRNDVWTQQYGLVTEGCCCCACCQGEILKDGRTEKSNPNSDKRYECGHILADKEGGKPEINNLLAICANCNKLMGTKHMTLYVKERWGKTCPEIYERYIQLCKDLGKDYEIPE